jgi:hypothetical protein
MIAKECLGSYANACPKPPSMGDGCDCCPPPTRRLFPRYALAGKPVTGKLDVPPLAYVPPVLALLNVLIPMIFIPFILLTCLLALIAAMLATYHGQLFQH